MLRKVTVEDRFGGQRELLSSTTGLPALPAAHSCCLQACAAPFLPENVTTYLTTYPCEKRFEKVVRSEIPKHYLTERGSLFSRIKLDQWLIGR